MGRLASGELRADPRHARADGGGGHVGKDVASQDLLREGRECASQAKLIGRAEGIAAEGFSRHRTHVHMGSRTEGADGQARNSRRDRGLRSLDTRVHESRSFVHELADDTGGHWSCPVPFFADC